MTTNGQNQARKIHDSLKHPIIDADGHWAEFAPLMREEFRKIGGGHRGGGPGHGEPAHPQLAVDVPRRAAAAEDRPGGVLVPADEEHARPRHRDDAAPPVRAPRRSRARLLRRLSHGRARLLWLPTSRCAARSAAPTTCSRPSSSAPSTTASFLPPSFRCTRPRRRSKNWSLRRKQLGLKVVMMGSLIRRPIPALVEGTQRPRA